MTTRFIHTDEYVMKEKYGYDGFKVWVKLVFCCGKSDFYEKCWSDEV